MITKEKVTKGKWLEENGFSHLGETYVVMGNSYPIKDALKEAGFKFSPLLRWHASNTDFLLPPNCHFHKINYNDIFTWDEDAGVTFMKEGTRTFLDDLFNPPRVSKSEYQGEIGSSLALEGCEVIHISGYSGAYGYTWIYTFRDENENEYVWFTLVNKALSVGMHCHVNGTVKSYSEYKGVKTTILTRCNLTRLDY